MTIMWFTFIENVREGEKRNFSHHTIPSLNGDKL